MQTRRLFLINEMSRASKAMTIAGGLAVAGLGGLAVYDAWSNDIDREVMRRVAYVHTYHAEAPRRPDIEFDISIKMDVGVLTAISGLMTAGYVGASLIKNRL